MEWGNYMESYDEEFECEMCGHWQSISSSDWEAGGCLVCNNPYRIDVDGPDDQNTRKIVIWEYRSEN